MRETPASSKPLFPLLMVNFIGTMGFTIVLPFLVPLVTRLGGNALIYGMMGATYSSFQLVGAPILGRDNVILTPHTGFYSVEALHDLQTTVARDVATVLAGGTPAYPITAK